MPSSDTQFKKGQSGNPAGKPKGATSYGVAIKRLLKADKMTIHLEINGKSKETTIKTKVGELNFYDALASVQLTRALKGDRGSIKDLIDRIEGTPTQSINMKQELSGGLNVTVNKRVINSRSELTKTISSEVIDNKTVETIVETVVNKSGDGFDVDEVF